MQPTKKWGIDPTRGKLWENNRKWTLDTCTLTGAAIGLALAARQISFRGVVGWKRYVEATTVGEAVCFEAGARLLPYIDDLPMGNIRLRASLGIKHEQTVNQRQAAQALIHDDEFMATVPQPARWYVKRCFTPKPISPDAPPRPPPRPPTNVYNHQVVFDEDLLSGCDHDGNNRTFDWNPGVNGLYALQQRADAIIPARDAYRTELAYVWGEYAKKEHNFFLMSDGAAKDDLRAELSLLRKISQDLWLKVEVLNFDLADSDKLKKCLEKIHDGSKETEEFRPAGSHEGWQDKIAPHHTLSKLRHHWMQLRLTVHTLDEIAKEPHDPMIHSILVRKQLGTEKQQKKARDCLAALERLLPQFENQVQKAEAKVEMEATCHDE